MGSSLCTENAATFLLANADFSAVSVDPLFVNYLYHTDSGHLQAHYLDIRDSLTSEELADFDRTLKSTFGNSSTVAFGSVGVVALALSLFFDVLVTRPREGLNETTDPIRQIFPGPHGEDSNVGVIISDYLRLVPQIANNQHKMNDMTVLYESRLKDALRNHTWFALLTGSEPDLKNIRLDGFRTFLNGIFFYTHLCIHLNRIHPEKPWQNCTLRIDYINGTNTNTERKDSISSHSDSLFSKPISQFLDDASLTGVQEAHEDIFKCIDEGKKTARHFISIKLLRIIGSMFLYDYSQERDDFIITY